MRNMVDAYAMAVASWAQNLSVNGLSRTLRALDAMREGTYGRRELARDFYAYVRDLADFRAHAALGMMPVASLDISSWDGNAPSNFVQIPGGSFASLALTPVANAVTNTVLTGLKLKANGGENSVRVEFVAATAGPKPSGQDTHGLFQGGIYHAGTHELIALVVVRTHLPDA